MKQSAPFTYLVDPSNNPIQMKTSKRKWMERTTTI